MIGEVELPEHYGKNNSKQVFQTHKPNLFVGNDLK